jgi:hypothetical protein
MPSQLINNEAISFVCAKNFTYAGEDYQMGDDFPQEVAKNIESLVRARFLIPVIESTDDKPRHWHREVRTREEAMEYLNRDRVQLRMHHEPDSDEVVDIEKLTYPETTPEAEELAESQSEETTTAAQAVHDDQYDPSYHTVVEVNTYLATADAEERERVLEAERNGKARKGILEA